MCKYNMCVACTCHMLHVLVWPRAAQSVLVTREPLLELAAHHPLDLGLAGLIPPAAVDVRHELSWTALAALNRGNPAVFAEPEAPEGAAAGRPYVGSPSYNRSDAALVD